MDIGSGKKYPSNALSNFAPHPFEIDGVECSSMEGFLQSLKFKEPDMQKVVCRLVGIKAKSKGSRKKWKQTQKLYWQNIEIDRKSDEYQELLDRAFNALGKNIKFQKALVASKGMTLAHSIGKTKQSETVLTRREFISRLTKLREELL